MSGSIHPASANAMAEFLRPPTVIVPMHAAPLTPEQAAKGHSTTTMVFDGSVHLTIETNQSIFYPKGVHEVPDYLVDHWYLRAHGVRAYHKPIAIGEQLSSGVHTSGKGKRGK